MRNMEHIEYDYMVKNELKELAGKRFDRIRKINDGKYRLKIQDKEIIIELGIRLNITKYIEESETDNLCQKINKELENKRLVEVSLYRLDRIVVFTFEGDLQLVIECFSKGNLLLVENSKIVTAYEEREWSTRKVKRGETYEPPESRNSNTLQLNEKYVIISMLNMPLGKKYCKYILAKLVIDEKKPGTALAKDEVKRIENGIAELQNNLKPYLFSREGHAIDYGLVIFDKQCEATEMKTLGECIDEYYWQNKGTKNKKLGELEKRLENQKAKLVEMDKEIEECKKKGDCIYENFEKIEKTMGELKKKKIEEIAKTMRIDKKTKKVEIEV
ncbi:MAG: NFACT family protein [Candidatus Micrarchaeota archaeon]